MNKFVLVVGVMSVILGIVGLAASAGVLQVTAPQNSECAGAVCDIRYSTGIGLSAVVIDRPFDAENVSITYSFIVPQSFEVSAVSVALRHDSLSRTRIGIQIVCDGDSVPGPERDIGRASETYIGSGQYEWVTRTAGFNVDNPDVFGGWLCEVIVTHDLTLTPVPGAGPSQLDDPLSWGYSSGGVPALVIWGILLQTASETGGATTGASTPDFAGGVPCEPEVEVAGCEEVTDRERADAFGLIILGLVFLLLVVGVVLAVWGFSA